MESNEVELEVENVVDIVQMVISTLNEMAEESGTPTFQDMVGARIKGYAAFTNRVIAAESSAAVATIINDHVPAKELNDKVQHYIKLAHRGIVSIDPSENVRQHVYNPIVQEISDEDSAELLLGEGADIDYADFSSVVKNVVTGAAAAQLLGGIKFWADPGILNPEQYALVHPISSTKH